MSATHKAARCDRCRRRLRSPEGWNTIFSRGRLVGFLCPTCQTPEENAEAEVNLALYDYSRTTVDSSGLWRTPIKS